MQFPNTKATKMTELVMNEFINDRYIDTSLYNRIYETVYKGMKKVFPDDKVGHDCKEDNRLDR